MAVLLCSFLLILATGRTNVRNYEKLQNSIEEIYKDRLVVKGLIFNLSTLLHKKELAIASNDSNFFLKNNKAVNNKIADLLRQFRETKLTQKEEDTLDLFSRGVKELQASENEISPSQKVTLSNTDYKKLKTKIEGLQNDLVVLSGIQLEEGLEKLKIGNHAVKQMNEFANIETYALVLIGIMMVALFFIPGSVNLFGMGSKSQPDPLT